MTSTVRLQSLNRLHLKRRSQRNNSLKKVIKQWHQLQHTNGFFGTLVAWRSASEGHYLVSDDFLDRIADAITEDESLLDTAIDQLTAAHKARGDGARAVFTAIRRAHSEGSWR